MLRPLGPTVDRRFAKVVAYKRAVTGTLSLVAAGIMVVIALSRGERAASLPIFGAALLLFTGGWALRDGFRLFRDLR